MTVKANQLTTSLPFLFRQIFPRPARRRDLVPFVLGLHVVQREHIDITRLEFAEHRSKLALGVARRSGFKLGGNNNSTAPLLTQPRNCPAQPLPMAAPSQIIHA